MDTVEICRARSKQSGKQCKNFASKGKRVCRIHGGLSKGAKTIEGKKLQKMANWKHGLRSQEAKEERRQSREMIKKYKAILNLA